MSFRHPLWVLAALATAVLVVLALRALERRRSATALVYSNLAFFESAAVPNPAAGRVLGALVALGTALLVCALAGPRIVATLPARDGAVVLCIDTSGSMTSTDVAPTRADAAKAAARAFINQTPSGTKIGIVSFSTGAEVVAPLSRDRDAVLAAVDRIPLPNGATAIGDALALAAQQLPSSGHRVVVLITDGVNNRGADPLEVAKFLGTHHVPVFTIGIGTNDSGELIPGTSEPATIDEDALRAISQTTGGSYANAVNAGQLRSALAELGRTTILERRSVDASLPFALGGGSLLLLTLLGALAIGRFP